MKSLIKFYITSSINAMKILMIGLYLLFLKYYNNIQFIFALLIKLGVIFTILSVYEIIINL